jgi:two-component system sensor histidine kinase QseC
MQKITPYLWFDGNAEEAVAFYTSVFKNSKTVNVSHYSEAGPMPAGSVMTIEFEIEGQEFVALNGGPHYKFTPAISLSVSCESQAEIDDLWDKLLAGGGQPVQCGWLTDKFGLSWQIVPRVLLDFMQDKDPVKARRTAEAMFKMVKLDIAALKKAYAGT